MSYDNAYDYAYDEAEMFNDAPVHISLEIDEEVLNIDSQREMAQAMKTFVVRAADRAKDVLCEKALLVINSRIRKVANNIECIEPFHTCEFLTFGEAKELMEVLIEVRDDMEFIIDETCDNLENNEDCNICIDCFTVIDERCFYL